MLATRERAALAERLLAETRRHKTRNPPGPTDDPRLPGRRDAEPAPRGPLVDLGVTRRHSRPHVSNDHPFSEVHFKTPKYCPQCPERFGWLEDARAFGQVFFSWYNHDHRHGALDCLTPAALHFGRAFTVRAQRHHVLTATDARHPERFVQGPPQPADLPTAVWNNPPAKKTTAQDAPGTTIVTLNDLRGDRISAPDDGSVVMIIDRGDPRIRSPLVSQCH